MMNLYEKTFEPNPDIVFTMVGEEAILLDQNTGKYYSLNPVGSRMWVLLAEHNQLNQVYEQLLGEFEVDEDKLRKGLEHMVSQFIENGLLV